MLIKFSVYTNGLMEYTVSFPVVRNAPHLAYVYSHQKNVTFKLILLVTKGSRHLLVLCKSKILGLS